MKYLQKLKLSTLNNKSGKLLLKNQIVEKIHQFNSLKKNQIYFNE